MKKFFVLITILFCCNIIVLSQKKYEMVIEKKDGTSVVIKTENINRTFFREVSSESGDNTDEDSNDKIDVTLLFGTWKCLSEEGVDAGEVFYEQYETPYYYRYCKNNTMFRYRLDRDTEKWEKSTVESFEIKVDNNGKTFILIDRDEYKIIELTKTSFKTFIESGDDVNDPYYWYEIETNIRVDDEELDSLMMQNGDL
ncbi:MAG: hypothetical protein J6A02_02330 [Prevotella sp.]|nr:hypothetical protein [Prevotella sp.]